MVSTRPLGPILGSILIFNAIACDSFMRSNSPAPAPVSNQVAPSPNQTAPSTPNGSRPESNSDGNSGSATEAGANSANAGTRPARPAASPQGSTRPTSTTNSDAGPGNGSGPTVAARPSAKATGFSAEFRSNCNGCHYNGRGLQGRSQADFEEAVNGGVQGMPSFSESQYPKSSLINDAKFVNGN